LYKRIAAAESDEALDELTAEIYDRFGPLPQAAQSLLRIAKLKLAVEVQAAETQRCKEAWNQQHERWRDLRQRERALDALRTRHARAERLRDQKREQKEQDEFALRTRKENLLDAG